MKGNTTANVKVLDTIFCNMFKEPKYLLRLYKCLHPEDKDITEDQLTNITLRPVIMNGIYNDLGFIVDNRLVVFVEAQTIWSPNILIRTIFYWAETLKKQFKIENRDIYHGKANILPPEFYVLYTGRHKEKVPNEVDLKKEFFKGCNADIFSKIKVIKFGKKNDIIYDYLFYCDKYNYYKTVCPTKEQAAKKTLEACEEANIMQDYLNEHKYEAVSIMEMLYDQDYLNYIHDYNLRKDAIEEGRAEGRAEGATELAIKMYKSGIGTIEEAAGILEISVDEFKALLNK